MYMQVPPQTTHGGFYFVLVSRNMSAFSEPSWPCAFIWQVGWSFPLASGFQNSHPTGSSKNFSLLNVFSLFVSVFGIGAPCWHFWEKLACCRVWCACWSLNTLDSCSAALYENKWALVVARFQPWILDVLIRYSENFSPQARKAKSYQNIHPNYWDSKAGISTWVGLLTLRHLVRFS